jgi:cobalt-zinc-cadmium efflux system membrane fusion protein
MKKFGITVALALVALAGAGYGLWHSSGTPEAANDATEKSSRAADDTLRFDANAPQLAFLRIEPTQTSPVPLAEPFNARIAYDDNRTARIFSPLAGRVVKITAETGQRVKAGDPLLWLDSPDYDQAVADAAKAQADSRNKKDAYERAQKVYDAQGIALKDLQAAEADWHQADAEAQRARARLKNLGADTATAGRFALRAPIGGVVSERKVNAGSEIQADADEPLFVITDPAHLWVLIDLPEQQIGAVKVGQKLDIEVGAWPGEPFTGKVTAVGGAMDAATRRIQVRGEISNDQPHPLMPEMFARVIPAASGEGLPRVPNAAVFTQGLYSYLFVEQSPGVLQRRRVTLARQGMDFAWVKEGLHAGERVVTSGALLLNAELGD